MEGKNIHEGHRKRLKTKFITFSDVLSDHELLELLLGYSISRKDTNELAHNLIAQFGSLSEVLNKPVDVLQSIDGVGEHTACLLSLTGTLNKRLSKEKQTKSSSICTINEAKSKLIKIFEEAEHEIFYALFLNKQDKVINFIKIDGNSKTHVELNVLDFTKHLVLNKPHAVIIAHNHFSKYPFPSEDDDKTTAKLYSIMQLYGVNFYDHIIVSGNEIYSYFYDNRLQNIKNTVNKNNI